MKIPRLNRKRTSAETTYYFWMRVVRRGPEECWEWNGPRKQNYGTLWDGAFTLAHRFSYELHHGPIPPGMLICHKCDNPPCVNPAHLFLGTHQDNADDCHSKGRANRERGEARYNCKLNAEKVIAIRNRYVSGERPSDLAKEYGVYDTMVHSIIRYQRWKHVKDPNHPDLKELAERRKEEHDK